MKSPRIGSGLIVKKDRLLDAMNAIRALSRTEVMVGIPDGDKNDREATPEDPNPPTNAVIGYVQEMGEPSRNLPARPFLVPGVEEAISEYTKPLQTAAKKAFAGDMAAMEAALGRAGTIAVRHVKAIIRAQDFAPLAPSTIEHRLEKVFNLKPKLEKKYNKMSPAEKAAFAAANITILIDTAALINSITWVLRKPGVEDRGPD
jgi:hypothetical protein